MAGGVGAGRLAGKVAVITGASSGIGRAGAIRFAAEGARVVVSSNREDEGKRVVREIEEQGGTAVFVFCDVTRPDDVEALIATAERTWGAVHVLYASAGVMVTGTAPETSEDDWRLAIEVNLGGPFRLAKFGIPALQRAGGGSIILTASELGLVGASNSAAYCAAKGGVVNLTRALAVDCGPLGIRVNCLCPGPIETPMLRDWFNAADDPAEAERVQVTPVPLGRIGLPDEIADAPLLLPVGAVERHGPHLPLGTDGLIPYELAKLVAGGGRAIVAPPMFYGAYSRPRTGGGRHFPGSVGLPGRTLEAVVSGLVADWMRQGFRRVAVLNGHFENSWTLLEAVEQAIEPYTATHRALLVHWWDQVGPADVRRIFGDDFPGWEAEHASITETSMLEYLRPDLVRADRKADGGATRVISYDVFPPSSDILWPNGIGNSALPASAELGKQLVELLVERIGRILDDEFPDG